MPIFFYSILRFSCPEFPHSTLSLFVFLLLPFLLPLLLRHVSGSSPLQRCIAFLYLACFTLLFYHLRLTTSVQVLYLFSRDVAVDSNYYIKDSINDHYKTTEYVKSSS